MANKKDDYGLTLKQRAFADHFFITGNAKESAKKAGYADKDIASRASKLKRDKTIGQYLELRSKKLLEKDGGRFLALAKQIESKDQYIVKTLEMMENIKDPSNSTKFKYWELIGRLRHLNEKETQTRGIVFNGKELDINEIMEGTSRLTGIMREIRFEAEIMQKSKSQNMSTQPNIPEVIDISPLTDNQVK